MAKPGILARVFEGDRLECQIVWPSGERLVLSGRTSDVDPTIDGPAEFCDNVALIHNAWAYAKFTYQKVNLPTDAEQKAAGKRAESHRETAEWIADLMDDSSNTTVRSWCSSCFTEADHRKLQRPAGQMPAYLCANCGSPSLPCAGPGCNNMAVRARGPIRAPGFCAEHRHDIPGFAKATHKMGSLGDYREFLAYEKANLSRTTKLVGFGLAGLAVGVPAALVAAPAIGGAVGTLVGGYSGAAASSYGLALLGGGSLAAGGLGMAGGTMVVTALGGALGWCPRVVGDERLRSGGQVIPHRAAARRRGRAGDRL